MPCTSRIESWIPTYNKSRKKKESKADHVHINITKEEKPGQKDSDNKASRQPGLMDFDDFDDDSLSTREYHRLQKITN